MFTCIHGSEPALLLVVACVWAWVVLSLAYKGEDDDDNFLFARRA